MTFHTCGVVYWLSSGLNDEESFESWQRQESFSPLQNIRTDSGIHPPFCSIVTGGFLRGKAAIGCKDDHSTPVQRLRMTGAVPEPPPIRLICAHRDGLVTYACHSVTLSYNRSFSNPCITPTGVGRHENTLRYIAA